MKKILLLLLMLSFVSAGEVLALSPTYSNPTESTINFYPMMRRQMEEDVTLDFENKPEEYRKKRTQKEEQAEYRAGNKKFNPNYGTGFSKLKFTDKKKEFTTDSNGNIIIKSSDGQE